MADEAGAGPHGGDGPGQVVVGEAAGPADHHRIGRALGHDRHAAVGQRLEHAVLAQHHRGGARGQQTGGHVGRAQQVGVVGRDAAVGQPLLQLGPGGRGVVGGEEHAPAGAAQAGHRLVDAGDGPAAQPDHPVEIEHPGPPGRRRPHGRRG